MSSHTSRMVALLGAFRRERNGLVADTMHYDGTRYGLNYGASNVAPLPHSVQKMVLPLVAIVCCLPQRGHQNSRFSRSSAPFSPMS